MDLAIGYTLNAALTHNPPFKVYIPCLLSNLSRLTSFIQLLPIGQCSKTPTSNLYFEANANTTFPYTNQTEGGYDFDGDGVIDFGKGKKSSGFTLAIPTLGAMFLVSIAAILV